MTQKLESRGDASAGDADVVGFAMKRTEGAPKRDECWPQFLCIEYT